MSFEYNPKEVKSEYMILNNGEYECEIVSAEETVSKAGNDMIKLVLCVYGNDGEQVRVYDYIVSPSTIYKLKSICRCCDIEFDGVLDEQLLVGKRMLVLLSMYQELKRNLWCKMQHLLQKSAPVQHLCPMTFRSKMYSFLRGWGANPACGF